MTEKRYYAHKHLLKENQVHDTICPKFMNIDETVEHMNNQYRKYKQLKEENEQLKSKLISKDDLIQQLKIKLNMDYYNKWKKCNLKYIEVCEELLEENKLYKKLSDENEQLKQQIKKLKKDVDALSCGEADWLIEEEL